jgi:hypothetical protein
MTIIHEGEVDTSPPVARALLRQARPDWAVTVEHHRHPDDDDVLDGCGLEGDDHVEQPHKRRVRRGARPGR